MSLAERCQHCFSSTSKTRGRDYFNRGMVDIISDDLSHISAVVEGSGAYSYQVDVDWSLVREGHIEAVCTCPHFADGSMCKHLWATILESDCIGYSDGISGKNKLEIISLEEEGMIFNFVDDEVGFGGFESAVQTAMSTGVVPTELTKKKKKKVTKKTSWQRQLSLVENNSLHFDNGSNSPWEESGLKRREVWYVLNVALSLQKNALIVELFQRETRKNGEFGKIKKLSIRRREINSLTDPEDRRLIQLMLGSTMGDDSYYFDSYHSSWQSYSVCGVAPEMYGILLPQLCETKRFVWLLDTNIPTEEAPPFEWDNGDPWRFQMVAENSAKKKQWQIRGYFYRGDQRAEIGDAMFVSGDGVIMFPGRLARFEGEADLPWINAFRQTESIEVPHADRENLLNYLWSQPHLPEVNLPKNLETREEGAKPLGRLSIKAPERYHNPKQLHAKVSYQYGDEAFALDDNRQGCFQPENNLVLKRDKETERELLVQLQRLGPRPVKSYLSGEADVEFHSRHFADLVAKLTKDGWIVESEGQQIRRAGAFNLSVTSGVDWFELDGQVDFDGVTAALPGLLKALRSGDLYIRLDDGSQGMLPEEWLAKYGKIAELADTKEDSLRFANSQALLLDALLAEQENVQVDRQFSDFRKKLRSFSGVKPGKEPLGFQGELRQYQREGIGWLNFLREFGFGGCLADDMGLGKTVQILALLQSRRMRRVHDGEQRQPSLVVVPKSLVFNWIDEAERFAPRLRVVNYTGTDRAEILENVDDCDLLVTTYGTLRRDIVKLKDIKFDYVILDEAQAIKNHNSQIAKASRLLTADHRLALSGTPIENHLGELWSLFEFLNPGMLGRSTAFASLTKNGRDPDDQSLGLLAQAIRPLMLRRTKAEVLKELPEKTEQTLHCEMAPKQRKQYDELRKYYRAQLTKTVEEKGINKSKIHVLEALLRLRQAACHPGLLDKKKENEPSVKLETLLEQVAEVVDEGHKALVFSQFTSLLSIVRRQLDDRKIPYEYLDGKTRKRAVKVKRFQEDKNCPLFLISLKAGGHGLNLTAADYVFILDPWWNPAAEAQAIDRAHRIGQSRRVFAYRIICRDTVEERIVALQQSKKKLADAIVSADNSLIRELTAEDLQLLLS